MSSLETQHTEHRHGSTSSPLTVIQLFEAQAAKTPHRIAISYDNQCLTYRELNIRANQLARIIRKSYRHMMGTEIRGDVICGLCMTKSLDIIVGILGILKAGAAYLPLDPTYPAERNKFILHDAGVTILVTQQILLRKNDFNFLKAPHKTYTLICIDAKDYQEMARRMPEENPNIINTERDLAYVIYTSGTSGNPKGVLIEHRSLLYSTTARMTVYKQRPQKFLLISPVIFDSSIAGIFGHYSREVV